MNYSLLARKLRIRFSTKVCIEPRVSIVNLYNKIWVFQKPC